MATIRDVAKKSGVGLGTVSRVINHSPLVSEATRQRVEQAIADLDFVPSRSARRLSLRKTLTIAAIAPFFTRPSFIERLRGIENTLTESEYDLIIYNVETIQRRDYLMREITRRKYADGVIILSLSPRDDDIPYLKSASVPIVLVDANHPSLGSLNRVVIDDVQGGMMATQHLIDLGHRRIGYISDYLYTPFNFTSSRFRLQGYQQALEAAGIGFRPEYHAQGDHGRLQARQMALAMLRLEHPPTAIFAASDTQAIGVLQAARELGLSLPQDLAVIGYDDIEVAEVLGLTTIRQLLYESGKRGVELLLEILNQHYSEPVCEVLPVELVIRGTTALRSEPHV
jgi:DNA-binding LacI/PurR family transcriptional regulator